jgi:hypothetical protein
MASRRQLPFISFTIDSTKVKTIFDITKVLVNYFLIFFIEVNTLTYKNLSG